MANSEKPTKLNGFLIYYAHELNLIYKSLSSAFQRTTTTHSDKHIVTLDQINDCLQTTQSQSWQTYHDTRANERLLVHNSLKSWQTYRDTGANQRLLVHNSLKSWQTYRDTGANQRLLVANTVSVLTNVPRHWSKSTTACRQHRLKSWERVGS